MTFAWLEEINSRPAVWSAYTASDLWTDPHISKQMLAFHLNDAVNLASRRIKFIEESVAFIVNRFRVREGTFVADFGCGPGLYTTRLAATGAAVTGIDFSKGSVAYARDLAARQGVRVDHVHADYLEYDTAARFNLIIMIMCDFGLRSKWSGVRRHRAEAKSSGVLTFNPGEHRAMADALDSRFSASRLAEDA